MLRRHFIPSLLAAAGRAPERLAALLGGARGVALVVDASTRRLIAAHGLDTATRLTAPPGSTVKPFTLGALLESGKLRPAEEFHCPGRLEIAGRNLTCSHPADLRPMRVRSAIAYSCNCFAAHYAERFAAGELARGFARYGLLSRTGWSGEEAAGQLVPADARLQALGEAGLLVTPAALAMAYTRLAADGAREWMAPVIGGMEDAVEFGTAQRARVAGLRVAGKTGSVRDSGGAHLAWFAGFAPAARPKYVVAVMVQGLSGGADAAPIAARILEAAWREAW